MPRPTGFTQSDRSRVEGDKGAENIGPRTYVLDASVDPTDARKAAESRGQNDPGLPRASRAAGAVRYFLQTGTPPFRGSLAEFLLVKKL
jgi:hypothetical protein